MVEATAPTTSAVAEVLRHFRRDTEDHVMTVIRDDRIDRHIRFRRPGTGSYGFDLITWPGKLCITGDMGTYVFCRIEDMFAFFRAGIRDGELRINEGYWAEKVLAADKVGGIMEWCEDAFKSAVWEAFRSHWEGRSNFTAKRACWQEIKEEILEVAQSEHEAMNAVWSFDSNGFQFVDFWEYSLRDYTHAFRWCLYAIVWGIQQYDAHHAAIAALTEEAAHA